MLGQYIGLSNNTSDSALSHLAEDGQETTLSMDTEMDVKDGNDKEDEDDAEFCLKVSHLAFHLFPDGPPPPPPSIYCSRSFGNGRTNNHHGCWVWPKPPSSRKLAPRAIVSYKEARESLPALLGVCRRGLTSAQLSTVLRIACELPRAKHSESHSTVRSPLVKDESYFLSLLKSLTLRGGESLRVDDVVLVASCLAQVSVPSRRCILQFLTLVAQIQELPSRLYPVLANQAHGDADVDAIRLLLRITKREHITFPIGQRLRLRLRRLQTSKSTTTTAHATSLRALSALLRLYARLHPDCQDLTVPIRSDVKTIGPDWHQFPDVVWEQTFLSIRGFAPSSLVAPASKRRCVGRLRRLDVALELPTGCPGSLEACLRNPLLLQRVLLSDLPYGQGDDEVVRLRALLPFVLKERLHSFLSSESYHHVVDRLLSGMWSFVQRTHYLLPEFQDFIEACLLDNWDGQGRLVLDVLTGWCPCPFADLHFRLLRRLERFLLLGDSALQYRIVDALTVLVRRWGQLNWSSDGPAKAGSSNTVKFTLNKLDILRCIVVWLDSIAVQAMVVSYRDELEASELFHLAVIHFFATVRDLCEDRGCGFLGAPSVPLVHRLLLVRSALIVDRLCHLLASYKPIFLRLKAVAVTSPPGTVLDHRGSIARLNDCIGDVCWALWSGFGSPTDGTDKKCRLYDSLRPFTKLRLHRLDLLENNGIFTGLNLLHGAVFVGFCRQYLQEHQERIPDNARTISRNHSFLGTARLGYLDFLNRVGFTGIQAFLSTFVGAVSFRSPTKTVDEHNRK